MDKIRKHKIYNVVIALQVSFYDTERSPSTRSSLKFSDVPHLYRDDLKRYFESSEFRNILSSQLTYDLEATHHTHQFKFHTLTTKDAIHVSPKKNGELVLIIKTKLTLKTDELPKKTIHHTLNEILDFYDLETSYYPTERFGALLNHHHNAHIKITHDRR
jgi:hypothetical protein